MCGVSHIGAGMLGFAFAVYLVDVEGGSGFFLLKKSSILVYFRLFWFDLACGFVAIVSAFFVCLCPGSINFAG